MAKDNTSVAGCMLAIIWFPLLIAASSIYHGFVLTKLWGWFIVPTFTLPMVSLPAAIGISLIVGYMAKEHTTGENKDDDSLGIAVGKATVKAVLLPSITLLMGYVVSRWM